MSDALCGPSNALQNFQKHASVDRTLQQDRLTSRQSPAKGFRSQNPRDGVLDPEFAAFEGNLAGPALPDLHNPAHFVPPGDQLPANHHPGPADWASDFQSMHISGPSHPVSQLQGPSAGPVMAAPGGWQNEFLKQQQRTPAQHSQNTHMNRAFQPAFSPGYAMQGASMNAIQRPQESQTEPAPREQFDESAFEAAFEQARADMESLGADTAEQDHQMQETDEVDALVEPATHEEIRIGADNIPASRQEDTQIPDRGADELARTAGRLLDSVRNNQSEKFQQSNFLALMRRIRDREVQVEGDEFRETAQSLHPGGQYYPGQQPYHAAGSEGASTSDTTDVPPESPSKSRPSEEAAVSDQDQLESRPFGGRGDTNALYEGWIHSQGLVDRRTFQPTFCFLGEGLERHCLD